MQHHKITHLSINIHSALETSAKLDDTAPAAESDSSSSSSIDSSDSEKDENEDEFDEKDVAKLNILMGGVSISVTTNEHCYFKIHA